MIQRHPTLVGVLSITLAALLPAPPATAQKDPTHNPSHHIEEIIVTAPLHKARSETVYAVDVLAGDALAEEAAATIGEVLTARPGISSASFGPAVGVPVIRGQGANRVRVLTGSLGLFDAADLGPDHAVAADPLLVERIEVIRGPATLLYGSGAIGGVVNLLDGRIPENIPATTSGSFVQKHSTASDENLSAFILDGAEGHLAWHLDGLLGARNDMELPGRSMDLENSNGRRRNGAAGLSWIGDRGFVGLSASRLDNRYAVPGVHGHSDHADGAEGETGVTTDIASQRYELRAELFQPFGHFRSIRAKAAWNDFAQIEYEGLETGTSYSNRGWEARVELPHRHGKNWHGVLGIHAIDRNYLAPASGGLLPPSSFRSMAVFAVEDLHHGDWLFEAGGRFEDHVSETESGNRRSDGLLSFSLAGLRQSGPMDTLSFILSRAERAPTVVELFAEGEHHGQGSYVRGDAELGRETSNNAELSWRHTSSRLSTEITAYYNEADGYIIQVLTNDLYDQHDAALVTACGVTGECVPVYDYQALDARFYGLEGELRMPLGRHASSGFDLVLMTDYVRGRLVGGLGNVPRMPPFRYGVDLGWHNGDSWHTSLRLLRAEAQTHAGPGESPTTGHTKLRAGLTHHLTDSRGISWTLLLVAKNLLDEDIREATSFLREIVSAAGRSFELGITARF